MKGFPFYCLVLGLTFIGPFILGLHKSISFNRSWKSIAKAILVIMLIYIPWDIFFTTYGIWQFNDFHTGSIYLLKLPLEEWLFFIATPFSCLFVWRCVQYYAPSISKLDPNNAPIISRSLLIALIAISLIILLRNPSGWYSLTAVAAGLGLSIYHFFFHQQHFTGKVITWFILLIPFFICNGILTGIHFWEYPFINLNQTQIEHFVVWYNPSENAGIRIWSVPLEDFFYGLGFFWIGTSVYDSFEIKQPQTI